ncbi:MAG: biotin/lipoyl-binding protein [Bacteroidales bacterium]|nr:biotin/lipoyl-binding protein [Bacteroidales bacterium]
MKKYVFNVDNQDYTVEILNVENGYAQVSVNNEVVNIRIKDGLSQPVAAQPVVAAPAAQPEVAAPVKAEAPKAAPAPVKNEAPVAGGKVINTLLSPLPGILLSVKVKVGDRVKVGDDLVVLDAMKMENLVTSEIEGVVLAIKANNGEAVMQDQVLIEFGA